MERGWALRPCAGCGGAERRHTLREWRAPASLFDDAVTAALACDACGAVASEASWVDVVD